MKRYYRQALLVFLTTLSFGCARKNFFAKTPVADPAVYQQLKEAPASVDSVTIQAGKHYKRSGFHNLFWGWHNRALWTAPVTVPVLDIEKEKGGLEIEKLGGGFQTTSLTLVDKNGFSYALRSLDKDPVEVLPKIWRKTFVANIIRDQTSAINPYGAFIIPPMAEAAAIPHSNPKLVYVHPSDNSFDEHQKLFSDKVFLIEEKYTNDKSITPEMGNAKDIVGSEKMLNNRFGKNSHFIDQKAFAKARLFDLFINDWDRHEGQWDWIEYKEDDETIYRPIPKDRDNSFYKFEDGLIPWLFSRNWAIRKFESFDDEYEDVYALMINSKFIDERALNEVTAEEFQELAKELQQALTDEVIERAVRQYPQAAYQLVGEKTIRMLKNRRDNLDKAAQEFYKHLAKEALVAGTDEDEDFEVKRLNDEETAVTITRDSDKKQIYHRVFKHSETELITLHGLAGDDKFKVEGEVNKGIKVVIVGGLGEDEIKDTSRVKQGRKSTYVYDTKRGTELEGDRETKDKRTHDVRVHAFDREGF
ncbi:hypothetical protein [Pontibacter ruber]|uniref:Uncharacterized protein n=1 Tax=Pontibacter ruber TaxID=1343895 RepID=A0ABW5D1E1_9BACT|nr:hypothetical protein [Pontibacter ruber]